MSRKSNRISIYDYPEHLNPFFEGDSLAYQNEVDNLDEEEDVGKHKARTTKYGTWGAGARYKIRRSFFESKWIDALNLSPAKNKVTKKLYSFKTKTIDKFQRERSKSNSFEHFVQRPEKRDFNSQKPMFGNKFLATSTTARRHVNVREPITANYYCQQYKEEKVGTSAYDFQGAKPKLRKKRAAPVPPMPPGAPLDPDTEKNANFNKSDLHEKGDENNGPSNGNDSIYQSSATSSQVEEESSIQKNEPSFLTSKPLEAKECDPNNITEQL